MKPCEATIIIPTTGNRGELLRYSVASVLNQTVADFELMIIGDGASEEAKGVIAELMRGDARIQFHDFPKHERRGEIYRHQVIKKSCGRNIFYLCDRDLMLPYHIQHLNSILSGYNFASTTYYDVKKDQSLNISQYVDYFGPGSQVPFASRQVGSLSCIGHTRDMYDQLEFGWRTSPKNVFTDVYMWNQFLEHPKCNPYSSVRPTIMYFKRGDYPGDPVEERARELAYWSKMISTGPGIEKIHSTAFAGLLLERRSLKNFRDLVIREADRLR